MLGSDVVYSEEAVLDLMETLVELCGRQSTIILAGELRNGILLFSCLFLLLIQSLMLATPVTDAILEYFLEAATKDFIVGRIDQEQWHPDYSSPRIVMYVLTKK